MISVKDLEIGATTDIFEDPMTEVHKEGRAELVEDLSIMVPCGRQFELHHWMVKFIEDHPTEPVERWIKVQIQKRG